MNPEERTDQPSTDGGLPRRDGDVIPLREATKAWFGISLQTFGGPAGQIAVMQRTLVDEKRWIGQRRFLHALSYCTLLPGPEAQQLSIYVGWLLNGVRGGLIAGTLFVLPGFVALLALTGIYLAAGDSTLLEALFAGLAPAVLAIVAHAVVRVGKRALGHPALVGLAVAAFLALSVFAVPFPVVVAAAAGIGWALGRWAPQTMRTANGHDSADGGPPPLIPDDALHHERPRRSYLPKVLALGFAVWSIPVALVLLLVGTDNVFLDLAEVSTTAALVTFGGAYAVLSYLAHQAVAVHGWLSSSEMVRGLALAETTPGPLIMVTQFVAGVAAFRHPPVGMDPWLAFLIGSVVSTAVLFVPSFTFVFLGAPYVERLRGNHALSAALSGITAAVVGVIANLAWVFALSTLWQDVNLLTWGPVHLAVPVLGTIDPFAVGIAVLAAVLLFRVKWSVLRTLGVCAALGLVGGLVALV
jgi:chromate transporter